VLLLVDLQGRPGVEHLVAGAALGRAFFVRFGVRAQIVVAAEGAPANLADERQREDLELQVGGLQHRRFHLILKGFIS
jgi:hypothetical protein